MVLPFRETAQLVYQSENESRYYAMIACHLDESFDPKQEGIFAVGGLLAYGRPLFELERRWKLLREKREIDIEDFKASECQRGNKQFAKFVADPQNITVEERKRLDDIWDRFLTIMCGDSLEKAVVFGIGVVQEDFYEVIRDSTARAVLGDSPYWFAYQFAMIEAAFLDGDQPESLGCGNLPGEDAPERVIFGQLRAINWKEVARRIGRPHSNVADACSQAMLLQNEHEWVGNAATNLTLGGDILWQALCAEWAEKCLAPEEAKKIVQRVEDAIGDIPLVTPKRPIPISASVAPMDASGNRLLFEQ